MQEIVTEKGTRLPLIALKGKPYLQVAHRVVWFRERHPLGRIETKLVKETEKFVIYEASISIPDVKGEYVKLADSIKREDFSHFPDANEKASTGAVGRALALCGFGTQFSPEIDEQDRIVDAPTQRVKQNTSNVVTPKEEPAPAQPGLFKNAGCNTGALIELQRTRAKQWPANKLSEYIKLKFGVDKSIRLRQDQFDILIGTVRTLTADEAIANHNAYMQTSGGTDGGNGTESHEEAGF